MVVIGGGDTAMDCVRTAVRQGATKVTCLYRRDRANMPGSQREVANAEEEGVEFAWLTAPRGFTGDDTVAGVRVARMRLGAPDATGRQTPEEIPDADYTEPAELVIKALGLRAGGAAAALGRRGARGDALGDGEGRLPDQADQPRGGLCRRRHRAGREPRRLGDPRRARGGGEHHGLARRRARRRWRRSRRRAQRHAQRHAQRMHSVHAQLGAARVAARSARC